MQVVDSEWEPGETVFGRGAGILFLGRMGRGSKTSQTPPTTYIAHHSQKKRITPMPTVGPADAGTKPSLERQFGNGSIFRGQKPPQQDVDSTHSSSQKSDTLRTTDRLTPSEIESLMQHSKKASEYAKMMLAREALPNPQATSEDEEEERAGLQMILGRAIQSVQMAMREAGKNLDPMSAKAILELADKGEIEESISVQFIRKMVADQTYRT